MSVTELKKKLKKEVPPTIERDGETITVPKGMELKKAISWLERQMAEDEQTVRVHEEIHAFPLEAAFALGKALSRIYGYTQLVPTPSWFGENPPSMIGLEVGVGRTEQVPWGRMKVPNVDGFISTHWHMIGQNPILVIGGEVKRKHAEAVKEIAAMTRVIATEESIYKGQAVRVNYPSDDEEWDFQFQPRFIDVSGVREDELIFPRDTASLVETNIFVPLEKTDLCRTHRVPLKRGVLLEGPYGVGKTLTAYVTAKKATANGWTFIYLDNVTHLEQAIIFARRYQPAVIFAEDIDQVAGTDIRSEEVNNILNTIDGVISKSSEIMVVLTTNHVERLNQALLRPGRLDAVVSVRAPDAETVVKLMRLYARGLLDEQENISSAAALLSGQQPAMIREAVERAKMAAIGSLQKGESMRINAMALEVAALSLQQQMELLTPKKIDDRSVVEKAASTLAAAIRPNGHQHA